MIPHRIQSNNIVRWFCVILITAFPLLSESINIPRLTAPIILDGRIDETAWETITSLPMTMYMPTFSNQPTVETHVLLGCDDDYLFIGAYCYDDEPEKIRAPTKKRDALIAGTNWFGMIFDTFNDKENAVAFFTTPSGLRFDAAVFNDAEGEMPINIDWNTFWDVATTRQLDGWCAEFRIPFSSLRFQEVNGVVTMGAIAWRWIPHKKEWNIFPAIPPKWGGWSTWKPSQAAAVHLRDVKAHRPFYITPYILGGLGQNRQLNDNETAYEYERNIERQGADL